MAIKIKKHKIRKFISKLLTIRIQFNGENSNWNTMENIMKRHGEY